MSVFGDFRNVWDQRFPGSDLPAAWEEDVRANLTKHKQKVAELREELEKEEFYVEYLERLLVDVAEHRACNKSEGERSSIVSDKEKCETGKTDSNFKRGGDDKKLSNKDVSKEKKSVSSDQALKGVNRDSVLQCVSELSASSSDSRIARSRSDVPEKISAVNKALENRRARCNTHPNISNYVTVIEVNGTGKLEGQKKEGGNKPEVAKKIPPRPPPKKPNKLKPTSSFSSADIEYGSSFSLDKLSDDKSTEGKSLPENKEITTSELKEISEEVQLRNAIKECGTTNAASMKTPPTITAASPTILAASPVTPTAPTEGISAATTPTTPTEKAAGEAGSQEGNLSKECEPDNCNASSSETKGAPERASTQDIPEEEEPYYDSVALDGEYVYLQTGGTASSTMTSGTSSGLTDADMAEIAAMTLPSSSPLSQSQFELQTNVPSSPDKQSNYVNIDYFLKSQLNAALRDGLPFAASFNCLQHSTVETRSSSVESEDDSEVPPLLRTISMETDQTDDVISNLSEGTYASNSSLDSASHISARKSTLSPEASKAEAERITMYKCIISSIIESETIYLECLNVMLQYMKALKATLATSQPVITEDEFNTIFYKVPDLHGLHSKFLDGLKKRSQNWDGRLTIGDHFRIMASNINIYGAFLHNYVRATETVKKCCSNNQQFAEITSNIRLKCMAGQKLSLEDLLHKPVARVQKNALVLHDLLKYTPESHPDHKTLNDALKMTQNFLDEFNMIHTKTMFPSADRAQRRLVKNSFIVELSDGHRKLRHLFLFNDVIACAKYKASGRDKFTFELKWYIPLKDIVIFEEPVTEPREVSPVNIVALKSQACTVRDQILWDERDDKRTRLSSRSEKQRKKLADLEAQLVLASPNLVFRVGNRSARTYIFFLSSEFERTQWIDAIHALQSCELPSPNATVSMYELQAWITACRNFLKTNMGSYLLRTGRDESLLVGDLHITLKDLHGLEQPADLFVCLEVDSYGHYFRKAKTKLVCSSSKPHWNEDFIIELEGSQNLRVLLYEESQERAILRGKNTVMLSRSWLSDQRVDKSIQLQNTSLQISLRFVPSEVTLRRVPTAKASGLFGAKIQQVCKRQKRTVPFIISSCVREVERRGMNEVGIYRVSGSATDVNRLKKSFETNSYEAEQLLKEVDIHSVTGILKLYLRELPEALFTDELYPKFLEAFNTGSSTDGSKQRALQPCFLALPQQNQEIINFLLDHLIKVNQHENHNKMSMHNLATVFGPTLLRPGSGKSESSKQRDLLAASTVDVMAQAGILYYFLQGRAAAHS